MADTYTLTITKKQAQLIATACELMSRIQGGQWREILDHLPLQKNIDYDEFYYDINQFTKVLSNYMIDNIDGWHTSFEVNCNKLPESHDILYDLYCVIRHKLSWENAVKEGLVENENSPRKWPEMIYVNYDSPRHWGNEPLSILER
jgi:hypothetical protein